MPMLRPQTGTPFLIVGAIILAVQFLCSEMTSINVFCLVSLPRARSDKTNEAGQLARPHEFSWTVFRTAGHKFRFRDLVVVVSVHFCPPTRHLVLRIFIFEIWSSDSSFSILMRSWCSVSLLQTCRLSCFYNPRLVQTCTV